VKAAAGDAAAVVSGGDGGNGRRRQGRRALRRRLGLRNEGKEIPREQATNAGDNDGGSTLFWQPSCEEEGVARANRTEAIASTRPKTLARIQT